MEGSTHVKDPRFVAGGRKGMAHRWAGHEAATVHVKMRDCTPEMQAILRSLIACARSYEDVQQAKEEPTASEQPVGSETEGMHHHAPDPSR
jgi:hypothetical protein